MQSNTNVAEIKPVKTPRKKSPETVLKQEMSAINRELAKLDKTLDNFKAMQKEVEGAEAKKAKLTEKLTATKAKLRTALGLD
jgi:hypothetical protein